MAKPSAKRTVPVQPAAARHAARGARPPAGGQRTRDLLLALLILGVGLSIRLIYLYDSADNPTFRAPIVDARSYDRLARQLAPRLFSPGDDLAGLSNASRLGFYWQPIFYPYALAFIYRIGGNLAEPVVLAKVVQALLGGMTCALTFWLARTAFDRRVGLVAGLLTALCGPLIFYETDLVAAGWAAFWAVLLCLLLLKTGRDGSWLAALILGPCAGLAVLTRPTFLPFLLGAAIWLAWHWVRARRTPLWIAARLAPAAAGFAALVLPVAARAKAFDLVDRFTFLPISGGLNFYIGNNENICETLNVRPGMSQWELLALPSGKEGDSTPLERSRLLGRKAREFAVQHPLQFAGNLGSKLLRIASGRELPRNEDLYVFREWSAVLSALAWKVGGFGFPWGVIFPLALVGLVWRWQQVPVPLRLYAVLYPLALILVFVSARYRVEMVPVYAVLAGVGLMRIAQSMQARNWGPAILGIAGAAAVAALASVPGPFCEEQVNYASEMYVWLGDQARDEANTLSAIRDAELDDAGRERVRRLNEQALENYEHAVRLDPHSAVARIHLGSHFANKGRLEAALSEFNAALERDGDFQAYYYRALVKSQQGDRTGAIEDLDAALAIAPHFKQAQQKRDELARRRDAATAPRATPTAQTPPAAPSPAAAPPSTAPAAAPSTAPSSAPGATASAPATLEQADEWQRQARALLRSVVPSAFTAEEHRSRADQAKQLAMQARTAYQALEKTAGPAGIKERVAEVNAILMVLVGDELREQARPLQGLPPDVSQDEVKRRRAEADTLLAQARSKYERATILAPRYALPYIRLGYVLKSQRRLDEAIARFDTALELEPDLLAYYYRGDAYSRKQDDEQALRDFNAALELAPEFLEAYLARSAIHERAGRTEEARADCQRALELAPEGSDPARQAQSRLKRLGEPAP